MNAREPRQIAFFVTVDWYFYHHYLDLARAFREEGYVVTIITGVHEHAERIRAAGLELVPFEVSRKGMNPLREIWTLLRLVKVLRHLRPTLLHNIAQKPVIYGTLAARLAGVPAIVNGVAGMGYLFTSNRVRARVARTLVRVAYRTVLSAPNVRMLVQNRDDQALVGSLTGASPTLIPGSGVDLTIFSPRQTAFPAGAPCPASGPHVCTVPGSISGSAHAQVSGSSGPPVVLLASRMLWDKGLGELVEAAGLLKERGVKARVCLVGKPDDGNPASVGERQLLDWHRAGAVEWWGYRGDMAAVLAEADIACLPSYREGLPRFLIEAAAMGLPMVTTDVPGCREAVEPGVSGFLVPPRNAKALADALQRLIDDPALRERFGRQARLVAEARFGQAQILERVKDVYRQLLDRLPGGL